MTWQIVLTGIVLVILVVGLIAYYRFMWFLDKVEEELLGPIPCNENDGTRDDTHRKEVVCGGGGL